MSGKHIIGMSEAIAARQGTMGQFLFTGLPGKGQPVDGRLLLSFGGERTAAGAAMGRVFPRYMALTVAAHHWTPSGERVTLRGRNRSKKGKKNAASPWLKRSPLDNWTGRAVNH